MSLGGARPGVAGPDINASTAEEFILLDFVSLPLRFLLGFMLFKLYHCGERQASPALPQIASQYALTQCCFIQEDWSLTAFVPGCR